MISRFSFVLSLVCVGVACGEAPPFPPANAAPRAPDSFASLPTAPPVREPCARLELRRAALAAAAIEPKLREAFTGCRVIDAGVLGLVVSAARGDQVTFFVALERSDGTSATSEPLTTHATSLPPELAAEAGGYRLDFDLPSLRWQDPVPHGGQRDSTLRGVRVSVPLDSSLRTRAANEPWDSVQRACASAPSVSKAPADGLWAAAQCARMGGLEASLVLAQVKERCAGLAAQELPLVVAAARADARTRDGLPPDKTPRPSPEEWTRVAPPGACFAPGDRLWDVDYTARTSPFRVPPVELDAAWELGLPRKEP